MSEADRNSLDPINFAIEIGGDEFMELTKSIKVSGHSKGVFVRSRKIIDQVQLKAGVPPQHREFIHNLIQQVYICGIFDGIKLFSPELDQKPNFKKDNIPDA